ncbi:MAG: septum formation initiator family protein [Comamonas sp.]
MISRIVPFVLLAILVSIHAQLWSGRGSIPYVTDMKTQIATKKTENEAAQRENTRLETEVNDLKQGMDMVEAKARNELGMLKPNEVLVQYTRK